MNQILNLSILQTGPALTSIGKDCQLIPGFNIFEEDPGVDRIIVSGNRFGHIEVPGWTVIPVKNFIIT